MFSCFIFTFYDSGLMINSRGHSQLTEPSLPSSVYSCAQRYLESPAVQLKESKYKSAIVQILVLLSFSKAAEGFASQHRSLQLLFGIRLDSDFPRQTRGMGGETVVGTRLHWHSHSQRERIDVDKVLAQVRVFCTRAATYCDGGILIAVGLPAAIGGSITGADSPDGAASTSSAFVESARDFMTRLQREVAEGAMPGKVEVIPMLHWGKFVPALNALVGTAADHFPKADTLLLQSMEIKVDAASVASLRSCFDLSRDLVVGAALPGHDFRPDSASQPVELSGLTSPWNTLALWNLEQLTKVGFALMGDALRLEVDGIGSAAGIEEVATIAMYQHLYANSTSPTIAKLVRVPSLVWQVDGLDDPERRAWHQKKMASKLQRAAAQIAHFGVEPGHVYHLDA
ncbi:unnamed protein product [Phytophthora lilii]|uniref:Unnamed protein product n=1 Tax=Phytophthora lilii TaxID=2077276 RepID=A0A9W6TA63_9STRA|nr:unnamed protein product [Phytophthora lilii]